MEQEDLEDRNEQEGEQEQLEHQDEKVQEMQELHEQEELEELEEQEDLEEQEQEDQEQERKGLEDQEQEQEQKEVEQTEEECRWQWQDGQCAAVLGCVFGWLRARDLWRAATVCRAWRAAALLPAHWRPRAARTPQHAHAYLAAAHRDTENNYPELWSWRRQYALGTARWRRRVRLTPSRAALLHAALAAPAGCTRRLAVLAEDADVSIWEQEACGGEWGEWWESWSGSMRARGWRRAESARWAAGSAGGAGGERLLLAGPLALSERWEAAVLERRDEKTWLVVCRAETGAGGACCWAGGDAFLTLQPQLLAPALAVTTVWLNSVSQESRSEYSGVTTPLLRIFNEAVAHVPHVLLTAMPAAPVLLAAGRELPLEDDDGGATPAPAPEYYDAISAVYNPSGHADRLVVAAVGAAGGPRGVADALAAWRVCGSRLRPPPLLAGAPLAERVRLRRERSQAEEEEGEPPPPSEAAVRALCSSPDDVCALGDQVLGLVLHPRGSCVWASGARGATCVILPALRRVLRVPLEAAPLPAPLAPLPPPAPPHYVTPDVDDDYFVTPEGGGSGRVVVVTARSGRCGARLRHAAPALAALLAPGARALLVLATDAVHMLECVERRGQCDQWSWPARGARGRLERSHTRDTHAAHTRHTHGTSMASFRSLRALRHALLQKCPTEPRGCRTVSHGPRTSCADTPPPPCAPCERAAPPPCRAEPARTRPALRVTCCAPPPCAPPPCDPQPQKFTCLQARPMGGKSNKTLERSPGNCADAAHCGAQLDRVARRLAAAESARRDQYEREASAPAAAAGAIPAAVYRLTTERECVRATDGCDYTLAAGAQSEEECPRCGPDRRPPAPRPVNLAPSDACEPDRGLELDPCAHRPRVLLHIDRSPPEIPSRQPVRASPGPHATEAACKRQSPRERLTTRIMESLNLKRESKISCPKTGCPPTSDPCANLPKPVAAPPRCREPSIVEQLRRRPGGAERRDSRPLHTSASATGRSDPCAGSASSTAAPAKKEGNLESMMRERASLKEAARGRVMGPASEDGQPGGPGAGHIDLRVPPSAEAVRVRVSLDFMPSQPAGCDAPTSVAAAGECRDSKYDKSRSLMSRSDDDSWLSIRGIQKKWSGYCKHDKPSRDVTHGAPQAQPRCGATAGSAARPAAPGAAGGGKPDYGRCPPCKPPRCSSAPEFSVLC